MEKGKKVSVNSNVLEKRIIQFVVLIVVVVLVVFLTMLVINKFRDKDVIDDGKIISNNRVSEEGIVIEHDPTDGMHANRISALLAGGNECNVIEEFTRDVAVSANDISNRRAYYAALEDSFYNSNKKEISLKSFKEAVQKLFGNDYEFNPEDEGLSNTCGSYKYDAGAKKFVQQKGNCKISCGANITTYKLVKVVEEYGKYTIDVKVLFGSRDEEVAYYSDYNRENLVTDNLSDVSNHYDEGATYRFIFESEGEGYHFVSSELVTE